MIHNTLSSFYFDQTTDIDDMVRSNFQLFVGVLMSYLRYMCLFAHSDVHHILCFVCLRLVSCVPNVTSFSVLSYLDCPFGLSNVSLSNTYITDMSNTCIPDVSSTCIFKIYHTSYMKWSKMRRNNIHSGYFTI
jgi:hypothetical protein